jgi:hypothetical protein
LMYHPALMTPRMSAIHGRKRFTMGEVKKPRTANIDLTSKLAIDI